ncbi:MAG TPA: glycosyltransferase family 39 protein [Ktedonobacteraceae bacterium]|nr:glycosyltransferase family 39 protein [Ktedonobacteraceae bacterium]
MSVYGKIQKVAAEKFFKKVNGVMEEHSAYGSSPSSESTIDQQSLGLPVAQSQLITQPLPISSTLPVQADRRKIALSEIWHNALLPYLGTRLLLVMVGLLANFYLTPLIISQPTLHIHSTYTRFPQVLWLMWNRFDSGFYLSIAQGGYRPAGPSDWVFYPLYPLLIAGVSTVLGRSGTAFNLAGILISNLAAGAAIIYLYLLVCKEFNREVARRTVLYLALFPMSFYLSAIYTEGLFLALAVTCIYYTRQRSWWIAGFCGGLAALTHPQGVMLAVPLAWEYLSVLSRRYAPLPEDLPQKRTDRMRLCLAFFLRGLFLAAREFKNWWTGLALFLVPAGLFAFMLYAKSQTGDLLFTFHVNSSVWGRQLSYPWRLLIYSLRHPIIDPTTWNFWLLNIIVAFVFLGFTLWAFRRLPMLYALYTTVLVLLPLSSNFLNSLARYYLVVFPAFILLALFSSDGKPVWHTFILVCFTSLLTLFMAFFVIGMPVIA